MKKTKIICTIGPSSFNEDVLKKLKNRGADYFRINLSHTNIEEIENKIIELKKYDTPIILDTEGCQVRTNNKKEIFFNEGSFIKLHNKEMVSDSENLLLNPPEIIERLKEGDLIFIDFNSVLLKVSDVSEIQKGYVKCFVLIGGLVGSRKAVYIDSPTFSLPAFSKKDLFAVELAKKYGIIHFTLSFMESAENVKFFRKLYPESILFSKIESKKGLENFLEIVKESKGILIDRGDLSHQFPIERIPFAQKYIIKKCNEMNKEVFVATNTLEQMSFSLKPSKAEVNDVVNTILDGATGIALTKETAVGKYPIETINMLKLILEQIEFLYSGKKNIFKNIEKTNYLYSSGNIPGLLIRPHGGKLVDRMLINPLKKYPLKKIEMNEETLMDAEQIAIGAFSPIEGFMNKKEFESVLNDMRLTSGIVWPIPLILRVPKEAAESLILGESVGLVRSEDKELYGTIKIEEVFKINKQECVKKLFGTNDEDHPGVKRFLEQSEYCVGGKINLIKRRKSPYKIYELTPRQTRKIFCERGWSRVIGFHTRNVAHRSHEFIQLEGLKRSLCDGILIHPVIGKKKKGDFEAKVIVEGYERLIEKFYPTQKVLFCSWASYSRYAGPREALFTALVRKNFGCSHFIVGRDHTGVGNFYDPEASHKIFNKFRNEEIGIIPIKFNKVFYSEIEKDYLQETEHQFHPEDKKRHLSGTEARKMLIEGKMPPEWFMRPELSKLIISKLKKGERVFVE